MDVQQDWVIVGRFGRPHGIKGLTSIYSYTEPMENILSYTDWFVMLKNTWQPLKIDNIQFNNKAIIAQVEGFPEREDVAKLTNAVIGVRKEQLRSLKPGEYYWHQLIGMHVVNAQGQAFGSVVEIMPTGSNDVLVVEGEKRHLIPYLPGECVLEVDVATKRITVEWDLDF